MQCLPLIEETNATLATHARLVKDHVVMIPLDENFAYSAKGTIQRKVSLTKLSSYLDCAATPADRPDNYVEITQPASKRDIKRFSMLAADDDEKTALASLVHNLTTFQLYLSGWKYIYVILGSVAMFWGLIVVILFPSSPMKAWFLTDREKAIAVRRLASNHSESWLSHPRWDKYIYTTFSLV